MNLLPQTSGLRPRLACEIASGGVVAARSPEPGAPLAAVAHVPLAEAAVVPNLKPGNIADRVGTISALRRALEQIGARANARNADLTLIIPDAAVRVLLLDFDSLPNKLSEALPIVRFRLKKLLPFEADDAMVSFQIMSTSRTVVRVLAVAIPRDVLSEYESVAREAGFEPGAVLPSTLAALAGLEEGEGSALLVNAHASGVTTAIVRAGITLLHRSVEMAGQGTATSANLPPALFERSPGASIAEMLPLVDREDTAGEWAAQEPLPEFGLNPYADHATAESAVEGVDGVTGLPVPGVFVSGVMRKSSGNGAGEPSIAAAPRYPYAAPGVTSDLNAEVHNALLTAPTPLSATADRVSSSAPQPVPEIHREPEAPVHTLAPDLQAQEIAEAVSVAVAYFEDSLGAVPNTLLSAGSLGAEGLNRTLHEQGLTQANGLRVRELVEPAALAAVSAPANVPRGMLAGVVGALKS